MNVKIQDLKDVTINGVKTLCTKSLGSYKETFFELLAACWRAGTIHQPSTRSSIMRMPNSFIS